MSVNKSDKDDWGKLKRLLKYLKGKSELKPNLSAGDMSLVKLWVDALYTLH